MKDMKQIKRIVVKVGSSTLTHPGGGLNFQRIDALAMVLSDIKNRGLDVVLVSSGAVAAGVAKMQMRKRPELMREKQAAASVGQCELMFIYDKFFSQYGQSIAQLLITKTVTKNEVLRANAVNTLETLLEYGVIPIVNENDSVAVDEIAYGDNDTLSAVTAYLTNADLLVLLSDICLLYTSRTSLCEEAEGIQLDGNTMRQKDFLYIASIWQKTYCSPDMVFPISAPSDRSFRKRRAPETGSLRFPVLFLHHGSYQ